MKSMLTFIFLLLSSPSFATSNWAYLGVIGKGSTAVVVLKKEDSGTKVFRKVGQSFANGRWKIKSAKMNQIVITDGSKDTVLNSTGVSYAKSPMKSSHGHLPRDTFNLSQEEEQTRAQLDELITMGEELIDSGSMTQDQVNELIAREMQQKDLIQQMDSIIEQYYLR